MYIREVRLELDIHELRKLEQQLNNIIRDEYHTNISYRCRELVKKLLEASNQ